MSIKFTEKNVINALHIANAKKYKSGIFANDVISLKDFVKKSLETQFGELEVDSKLKATPFCNVKTRKQYSLFYPATCEEIFGKDYINYEDAYDNLKDPSKITYSDVISFIKPNKDGLKQYLFSGRFIMEDFIDGEHYALNYEGKDTYGKNHGKEGQVALLIRAPNANIAKFCADLWFNCISGYRNIGRNCGGFGFVNSKEYYRKRYFGEFDANATISSIIKLIKFFDTKDTYNLNGEVIKLSVKDIFTDDSYVRDLKRWLRNRDLLSDMYLFELDTIKKGTIHRESLKSKVLKANLKYGIYDTEVENLYKNFDKTIELIKESEKRFEELTVGKDLDEFLNKTVGSSKYLLVRTPVSLNRGKDDNAKILAVSFCTDIFEKFTFNRDSYCEFYNRVKFLITDKNVYFDDLENCPALESGIDWHNDRATVYRRVKILKNSLAICSYYIDDNLRDSYITEWGLDTLKEAVQFKEVVPKIKLNDLIDIRNTSFTGVVTSNNISKEPLEIKEVTKDGHKCIAVSSYIAVYKNYHNGYTPPEPNFTFPYYEKLLKNMSKFGYHLITGENFETSNKNHDEWEKVTLIFAQNKKGTDYSSTLQKDYWTNQVSKKFEGPIW